MMTSFTARGERGLILRDGVDRPFHVGFGVRVRTAGQILHRVETEDFVDAAVLIAAEFEVTVHPSGFTI
jgi:hypothetical protein